MIRGRTRVQRYNPTIPINTHSNQLIIGLLELLVRLGRNEVLEGTEGSKASDVDAGQLAVELTSGVLLVGGVANTNGGDDADNNVSSNNGVLELGGDLGVELGRLLGQSLALLLELLGELLLLGENVLLDLSELLLDLLGLLLDLLLLSGGQNGALLLLLGLRGGLVGGVGVALVLVSGAGLVGVEEEWSGRCCRLSSDDNCNLFVSLADFTTTTVAFGVGPQQPLRSHCRSLLLFVVTPSLCLCRHQRLSFF